MAKLDWNLFSRYVFFLGGHIFFVTGGDQKQLLTAAFIRRGSVRLVFKQCFRSVKSTVPLWTDLSEGPVTTLIAMLGTMALSQHCSWVKWSGGLDLASQDFTSSAASVTGNRGSCTNFGTGMFSPWNSTHQHGQKVTPTCLPNGTPNQSVDRRCCTCFRRVSIQQPDPVKFNQFNPFMGEMELRWFLDKARNDFDVGNQFLATSNNAKDQTRRQQGRLVC